ncbi:hypothetical protein YK48G_04160 [Lentilactobacillus fungorum]|uniref:IrrE N-terminal-like domain-containing protein n=1 Tax=Lentilactobacillus fungorum TaxID=2201250 RepID=A0ABQ3VXT2_9LACO|nr:hypothetical protein [Lentilactobacillus fungorum]GHP12991.1 hypothetical protein YK48G_04160 [Lentilactobacillus fungorum]
MKKISKVCIGGINYQIKFVKNLEDTNQPCWGLTEYEKATIFLRDGLSWQKRRQTLIHEMVHVMLHEAGLDDVCNDEKLVNPLGNVLNEVLADNPKLHFLYLPEGSLKQ